MFVVFLEGRVRGEAYYTPEQYTRALKIQAVERLPGTEGACCVSDHHP